MKRNITTFFITLSVLFSLTSWRALSSRAASSHRGAGQQVGKPFRSPASAADFFHDLALKSDGTVLARGYNDLGQPNVPASLTTGSYQVFAWGRNDRDQATVPANLSGVTALAGGWYHSLALKSDGTVVAWGSNGFGQSTVPTGLSNVRAITSNVHHNLVLLGWPDGVAPTASPSVAPSANAAGWNNTEATVTNLKIDGSLVNFK